MSVISSHLNRIKLSASGQLVSSNQLLHFAHEKLRWHKYAIQRDLSFSHGSSPLLSSCEKATRNWRRIQLSGSETGTALKAWQRVLLELYHWGDGSHFRISRWRVRYYSRSNWPIGLQRVGTRIRWRQRLTSRILGSSKRVQYSNNQLIISFLKRLAGSSFK